MGEVVAEVRADQRLFDHVELGAAHGPLGQVGERCTKRRRGALQAAGEAAEPALSVAAFIRAVVHAGSRDTRSTMSPEDIVSRLLYRDGLMLIIDKPAGLAVHRGPKGGASLEDWFDALRFGLPRNPALAHRLDKETSGCLVLGRHRKALADLHLLFRHGKVGKTYWGVVEGGPPTDEGRIDLPLGRLDDTRGWWMKHDPNGLPSSSTWKVLGRAQGFTWLELEPLTGRTHQLRVHCCEMGWP